MSKKHVKYLIKILLLQINSFVVNAQICSDNSIPVCNKCKVSENLDCTFDIHNNSLNLPSFLTENNVQSELIIITSCNSDRIKCSGVILNNHVNANDNELLILTARHCLHENFVEGTVFDIFNAGLASLVDLSNSSLVFNVSRPSLNVNSPSYDKFYVNASLELIEESLIGDIALLKANIDLPPNFNVYYAGWTAESQIDISSNEKHYNISNPKGSPKKVTTLREGVLESFQAGWFKANLEDGVLYGGSSGSPFYNEAFKVYGVLSGGADILNGCPENNEALKENVFIGSLRHLFFFSSDVRNALNNNNNFEIIAMGGNRVNCYRNNLTDLKGNYWPHNIYQPNNYIEIKAENKIISSTTEPLNIKSGSEYTFIAGEEIVFAGEVTIEQGAEFTAKIFPCLPNLVNNNNQGDEVEITYLSETDKIIIQTLEERGLTIGVLDSAYINYITKKDTVTFIKLTKEINEILNIGSNQSNYKTSYEKVILFPNPNTGIFTIYVQTLNEQEQLHLCVIDVYGKQLFNQQITNSVNHQIDLSAYSKGIYYVSVTGSNGFREVKKVVVN